MPGATVRRQREQIDMAELDLALKGGSRLAGELELERALVEVTRPAAPAAAAG